MCDECKKYEEKTEEDKKKFDTSKKGLQFWQKHRDKQIKCNRVNKIECINHVDKRHSTALRDLRDAWRGHKLPDGKAIGGKKNCLTKVNIKKLQVNYDKAIRSNGAPDVKTAKDHKDAVDKMKKAVMASLYHGIMLKDDKVRHQFCPSGDTSWCKFRRLGNMKNAPQHLEPVFLDILEPSTPTVLHHLNCYHDVYLESPRMCLNQSTPFFGRSYPSTNFMEPRECT